MDSAMYEKSPLFSGMNADEIYGMLDCLEASHSEYDRGETIFHTGDTITRLGVVLSGSVLIENDDIWGNRSILSRVGVGQIFGETYACLPGEPLLISAVAAERTRVLLMNMTRLRQPCVNVCARHGQLIANLLEITARKNLALSRRILHTSPKTIRGRLLSYFSELALQTGSRTVVVPFDRQQLADYLSADRSALCSELSKMQRDGLLTYNKNTFCLSGAGSDGLE